MLSRKARVAQNASINGSKGISKDRLIFHIWFNSWAKTAILITWHSYCVIIGQQSLQVSTAAKAMMIDDCKTITELTQSLHRKFVDQCESLWGDGQRLYVVQRSIFAFSCCRPPKLRVKAPSDTNTFLTLMELKFHFQQSHKILAVGNHRVGRAGWRRCIMGMGILSGISQSSVMNRA